VSLERLTELSQTAIFVKGPHTGGKINFDSRYEFGYYNIEFVKWLGDLVLAVKQNTTIRTATQPMYDKYLKKPARTYHQAYRFLEGAVDLEEVKKAYLNHIANRTLPQGYIHSFDKIDQIELQRTGHDFWHAHTALGFWVRRAIDKTDIAFFDGLKTLLETYDAKYINDYKDKDRGFQFTDEGD